MSKNTDYAFSRMLYQMFEFSPFVEILNTELTNGATDLRPIRNLAKLSQIIAKYEYLHRVNIFTSKTIDNVKETYGMDVDGWINKIFWGDNLQVMSHMLKEFRGKIDLIYIDPPFDSKADYKKKIKLKGIGTATSDSLAFEDKQYGDIWTNDEYLQFMYERLTIAKELLSDTGSIYLHCDYHKNHHLKLIMDEIFGVANFQNEIIWCYNVGGKGNKRWARKHDNILFYSKSSDFYFNGKSAGISRDTGTKSQGGRMGIDKNGRPYQDKLVKVTGKYYRYYLDEPKIPEDWWTDINSIQSGSEERSNYPTQKPEALLERIIKASTNVKCSPFVEQCGII